MKRKQLYHHYSSKGHRCLQSKTPEMSKASPNVLALLQESPDSIGAAVVRDGSCSGDPGPCVHHQELRVVDGLVMEQRVGLNHHYFLISTVNRGSQRQKGII